MSLQNPIDILDDDELRMKFFMHENNITEREDDDDVEDDDVEEIITCLYNIEGKCGCLVADGNHQQLCNMSVLVKSAKDISSLIDLIRIKIDKEQAFAMHLRAKRLLILSELNEVYGGYDKIPMECHHNLTDVSASIRDVDTQVQILDTHMKKKAEMLDDTNKCLLFCHTANMRESVWFNSQVSKPKKDINLRIAASAPPS